MVTGRSQKLTYKVALAWGAAESLFVIIFGTTLFPVGWFVIFIALISGYYLASSEGTIRALLVSQVVGFLISLLVLQFVGAARLFSVMPLLTVVLFLLSLSSLGGALLGDILLENPTIYRASVSSYRAVFLAIVLALVAAMAAFGLQVYVDTKVREANPSSTLVSLVSNREVTWNNGTEKIWVNFTTPSPGSGNLYPEWHSSSNLSFNLFFYPHQVITIWPDDCCNGHSVISVVGPSSYKEFIAWFNNNDCSNSGGPSGWVNFTIDELYLY